jgi:hypothetical protein
VTSAQHSFGLRDKLLSLTNKPSKEQIRSIVKEINQVSKAIKKAQVGRARPAYH